MGTRQTRRQRKHDESERAGALRQRGASDPCVDGPRGSRGRRACASAAESRASCAGDGCLAGTCACSRGWLHDGDGGWTVPFFHRPSSATRRGRGAGRYRSGGGPSHDTGGRQMGQTNLDISDTLRSQSTPEGDKMLWTTVALRPHRPLTSPDLGGRRLGCRTVMATRAGHHPAPVTLHLRRSIG